MNIFVSNKVMGQNAAGLTGQGRSALFQTGDVISAILTDITNGRATLRSDNDFTFHADAKSLNGTIGETLTFTVTLGRDGISLTQTGTRPSFREVQERAERGRATLIDGYAENRDMINTLETIRETEELRAEHRKEQSAKVAKAIASIRRAQSFMSGVGRRSAVAALVDSGLDISKISFADFNRVMHNVERTPENALTEEEMAAALDKNFKNNENAKHIVSSLHENGLEISEKNIGVLENAYEKLPEKVEEPAIIKLISDEQDLTLDNVYKSRYSAAPKTKPNPAPWEALQDAIMRLFQREGIAPSEENLYASRFLLDRDLPLTRSNIERVLFLGSMSDNIPREAFFSHAATYMAEDRPVGSMVLTEIARFAEIQLKFSQKAAHIHQSLGIDLEPLRQQVRSLNMLEADAARYLRMVGGDLGRNNILRMTNLFGRLQDINPTTVNVHGGIMKGQSPFTIDSIHQSVQIAKANQMYEQYATVPNPKMGDTFQRVKNLFAPLLEGMNIRATNENLKASFILSKNEIDVNRENLDVVKEIEEKINTVASKLHPVIAANMVKDGLNPLEMHVDQVLAYIGKFNKGKGFDNKSKIASHILEMDESGSIDSETRKSMLAMYRMLGVIRKDGARVLGLAAEMGTSVTLGELMEMSKNFTKIRAGEAVNIEVTEQVGELDAIIRPEGNIRGDIEAGTKPPTHMDLVLDKLIDAAAPSELGKMLETPNQAIEDIAASINTSEKHMEKMMNEQIQTFLEANPEVVHFLNKKGISATAGHIRALEHLTRSHRALAEELGETDDDADVAASIPDAKLDELRKSGPAGVLAKILDALGIGNGNRNASRVESLLAVTHGLNGSGEKGFQMPVMVNGRIANLQLYVLNEKALSQDGAKILLSLDTARLGIVTSYFSITGGFCDIVVTAGTNEAVRALEAAKPRLEKLIGGAGVKLGDFSVVLDAEPALETSLPPDAIEEWAKYSPEILSMSQSAYDYRV